MAPPIFVVGTQRSGTTLLCRMLTAHPNLFVKNELTGVRQWFSGSHTRSEVLANFDAEMRKTYGLGLEDFLAAKGKNRWGLKDPGLTYSLDYLERVFPEAKVLVIMRDGRAVAKSYMTAKWGIATNAYTAAKVWQRESRMQADYVDAHPGTSYLVKYEDLVREPEAELRRICAFLGEEFSDVMCEYYKQPAYLSKSEQSKNVFKELDAGAIDKWKAGLSKFEVDVIDHVASDQLARFGYERAGRAITISKGLELYYRLHQRIVGELQLQNQLRLKPLIKKLVASKKP